MQDVPTKPGDMQHLCRERGISPSPSLGFLLSDSLLKMNLQYNTAASHLTALFVSDTDRQEETLSILLGQLHTETDLSGGTGNPGNWDFRGLGLKATK